MKDKSEFTILVVDDEPSLRELMSKYLEMDGYKTIVASGAKEAIQKIQDTRIDFIISDVRMPEGDGLELLAYVRKINPDIPVVILVTGFAELTREEAIKLGAKELLIKPINFEIIEKYIQESFTKLGAACS